MDKKCKNKDGFTLVELMAVTFIIALISALVLANYRTGQSQYILSEKAQSLAQFIRDAQNRSLASAVSVGQTVVPSGGYGVSISPTGIFLFQDFDGDKIYTIPYDVQLSPAFDLSQLSVSGISAACGGNVASSQSSIYITFTPPNPDTYIINVSGQSCSSVIISLNLATPAGLKDKLVSVSNTGLVEVQ